MKMLAFEHECTKPTRLRGTVPWLKMFSLHAERLLAYAPPPGTAKKLATVVGSAVNGRGPELTESAAYPEKLCDCIAQFHMDFLCRSGKRARPSDDEEHPVMKSSRLAE